MGRIGAKMNWAHLAKLHQPNFLWGSSQWLTAPLPHSLLMPAKELQTSGKEPAAFRLRFGRQDDGSEATSFFTADSEKASGPLGMLAEELSGYSRKKGGFSFRFGRR
ncbi:orexigenic neuropeptide QRFP [Dasypus novemcinctus]|uniref:orexigenic neuropeptide QRFP n=1 Tax=Dasypus novemcinctus TaxID=9361 RepID=UPI0039C8D3B9